nr:hypothetical protein [Chlorobium phaeovibrioides]
MVICDFKGFIPPEMVKRRPAVIVLNPSPFIGQLFGEGVIQ